MYIHQRTPEFAFRPCIRWGGLFFLLVISDSVDVLVHVSGCALEAKSVGDGDELELEDIGTKEDYSCEVALGLTINRFRTARRDRCRCRVGFA